MQDYPQLHIKFETTLVCIRPCLKEKIKNCPSPTPRLSLCAMHAFQGRLGRVGDAFYSQPGLRSIYIWTVMAPGSPTCF